MENIKKLKNIKEFLHKQNEYWWNEERKDLDLKYYVPTDLICEQLEQYEIGISQEIYEKIKQKDTGNQYFQLYDEYNYYEDLASQGIATYLGGDNTYNHCGRSQNDFQWHSFKIEDKIIVLLAFHINGDIRANYTDYIVLEFEYDTEFLEVINNISYENDLTFDLKIDSNTYEITPFVFDECLEVYNRITDDYIYNIFGINDEEITKQIKERTEKEEI